jgi:hypothetical protein
MWQKSSTHQKLLLTYTQFFRKKNVIKRCCQSPDLFIRMLSGHCDVEMLHAVRKPNRNRFLSIVKFKHSQNFHDFD